MLHVYVDADACPVKPEIFRVAGRYQLQVTLVANSWMRTPDDSWISLEVVGAEADAADDWIVGRVEPHDIVITSDIPLASRSVKAGGLGDQQLRKALERRQRRAGAGHARSHD